jgi:hypothetical protein
MSPARSPADLASSGEIMTVQPDAIERLTAAVERLEATARAQSIRVDDRWIEAADIAAMLKFSVRHVAERVVCMPGFPEPLRFDGGGNRRWNYAEVVDWIRTQQQAKNKRITRGGRRPRQSSD